MASKLKFNYGRPVNPLQFTTSPEGYNAPAASPRELAALDLESLDGLYSHMIDKSPSVEFLTLVGRSSRGENPQIGTLLRRETILLKGKFANENGFALPRFATVGELLDFFEFWDPAAAEEVFRANWNSLPASMRTYPEFRAYVELHPEEIFPLDKAFTQLGPLRSRLNQYVMTTEDSEEFLKQAFRQYVLSLGSEDSKAAERLKVEVENSGAVMQLFRNKIFAFLHMPAGMALRIPVAVTAADYTLSRVEDRPSPFSRQSSTNSGPFRNGPYSPYSKPSSMDHNTKP
ncbi:MAG: hypothetical protein ACXVA9_07810, partial [Bdellovibrionales bacterium]